jgi:hypothetical protein
MKKLKLVTTTMFFLMEIINFGLAQQIKNEQIPTQTTSTENVKSQDAILNPTPKVETVTGTTETYICENYKFAVKILKWNDYSQIASISLLENDWNSITFSPMDNPIPYEKAMRNYYPRYVKEEDIMISTSPLFVKVICICVRPQDPNKVWGYLKKKKLEITENIDIQTIINFLKRNSENTIFIPIFESSWKILPNKKTELELKDEDIFPEANLKRGYMVKNKLKIETKLKKNRKISFYLGSFFQLETGEYGFPKPDISFINEVEVEKPKILGGRMFFDRENKWNQMPRIYKMLLNKIQEKYKNRQTICSTILPGLEDETICIIMFKEIEGDILLEKQQ